MSESIGGSLGERTASRRFVRTSFQTSLVISHYCQSKSRSLPKFENFTLCMYLQNIEFDVLTRT
jgi:hypothetical protein